MRLARAVFVRRTIMILVLSAMLFGPTSILSHFSGLHSSLPAIPSVSAATTTSLGFDCAYGSSFDGAPFPSSVTTPNPDPTYSGPDYDGSLNTSCQATYLADQETPPTLHPLVSDNPTTLTAGLGGGLTIDVVAALNSSTTLGGFDISVQYDPTVLNAVLIDQSGLIWGGTGLPTGAFVLTLAKTIDPVAGTVRLSQALVVAPQQSGNSELFRIRFDIIAASSGTPITLFNDVLVNPSTIIHNDLNLNGRGVDTTSIFNVLNGGATLNFVSNWTFTPKPEIPGSPLTFTAQASCAGCTGSLVYKWDFSSIDTPGYIPKIERTGSTVTVSAPPPVINRVTLNITDTAGHFALVSESLPLELGVSGTSTLVQGIAGGSWTGIWLGGVVTRTSGYSGTWRLCPGSSTVKTVCSVPTLSVSQPPGSITQTTSAGPVTYNFGGLFSNSLIMRDAAGSEAQLGLIANSATQSFLANVTGSTPAFTVSVTATTASPVVGTNDTLTATITYDSTYPASFQSANFNYVFDFGDGTPTVTTSGQQTVSLVHNFTSSGNFAAKVIAQETTSRAVSQIIENGFLTVNAAPVLCIVVGSCDFTISTPSIVAGGSATFTATASGGSPPYFFAWNFGDGSTLTGQTANHAYQSAGTYNLTLTVTDSSGQTQLVKKTITVSANPIGPFSSPLVLAGIAAAAIIVALAAVLVYTRRRRVPRKPEPSSGSP